MADYKNLKSEKLKTDVLIIGGGTAGCYAAITISEKSPECADNPYRPLPGRPSCNGRSPIPTTVCAAADGAHPDPPDGCHTDGHPELRGYRAPRRKHW